MRISGINNVNPLYKANRAKKAYGTSNVKQATDSVAISDFAKELSVANRAVKDAPDVRESVVDDLKHQIDAGEYNVSAAEVADKLVESFF